MKVILISGKAQAGKDTVGDMLKEYLPDCYSLTFAGEVKLIAKRFGWDWNKDERGRQLLQSVGDIGRAYNQNIWVNRAIDTIAESRHYDFDYAIVTDARYINEIEHMRESFPDLITIRVERFGYDNGLTEEQKQHSSETELDTYHFDYVIHNNGAIEDMRNEIKHIVETIG